MQPQRRCAPPPLYRVRSASDLLTARPVFLRLLFTYWANGNVKLCTTLHFPNSLCFLTLYFTFFRPSLASVFLAASVHASFIAKGLIYLIKRITDVNNVNDVVPVWRKSMYKRSQLLAFFYRTFKIVM